MFLYTVYVHIKRNFPYDDSQRIYICVSTDYEKDNEDMQRQIHAGVLYGIIHAFEQVFTGPCIGIRVGRGAAHFDLRHQA